VSVSGFPVPLPEYTGDLSQLQTNDKSSLVAAINELKAEKANEEDVGDISTLNLINAYIQAKQ